MLEHPKGPVGDPGHCVVLNPVMSERWKQLLSGCQFTQKQGWIKSLGWFYDSHPDPDCSSLCVCVCVCAHAYAWEGNWERPFRCTVQWRMINSFLISVAERAAGPAVWGPERSRVPVASVTIREYCCYIAAMINVSLIWDHMTSFIYRSWQHLSTPRFNVWSFGCAFTVPAQNSRHT